MRTILIDRLRAVALLGGMLLGSCVEDPPVVPPNIHGDAPEHGVLVVNEGLWHQDNATLTLYDPVEGSTVDDFFGVANPGERLGDTGNDIVVRGTRAWIVVTTSQNIEVVELPSGRSRGRVRIGSGDPRSVAIVDDSTGYATLVAADAVVRFDPRDLSVGKRIAVGPAPEGIASIAGRVFVANSGYGFLRRDEPRAGTVAVLDARTGSELALLAPGSNPMAILADAADRRVYVLYGMPHADSSGGVVAYDAASFAEVGRWEVAGAGVAGEMAIDAARDLVYVIDGDGTLVRITTTGGAAPARFLRSEPPTALGFYGVGVAPLDGTIYAGAITSFAIDGTVVVFDRDGVERHRFDAGLNPASFGFY